MTRSGLQHRSLQATLTDAGFLLETRLLGEDVVFPGKTGADGHVILIDSPSADSVEIIANLRLRHGATRIALLCERCEPTDLQQAFTAGVDAVILWSVQPGALVLMIRLLVAGEKFIPSPLIGLLPAMLRSRTGQNTLANHAKLSPQELEILRCLAEGISNAEISARVGLGIASVRVHVRAILKKLNALNRTQAAIWAITNGIH